MVAPVAVPVSARFVPAHNGFGDALAVTPVGIGSTVTVLEAIQLPGISYIILAVPAVTPVTIPDVPIVALPLRLLHVPPVIASLNDVDAPIHTEAVPFIAPGAALIVTTFVEEHPPTV